MRKKIQFASTPLIWMTIVLVLAIVYGRTTHLPRGIAKRAHVVAEAPGNAASDYSPVATCVYAPPKIGAPRFEHRATEPLSCYAEVTQQLPFTRPPPSL